MQKCVRSVIEMYKYHIPYLTLNSEGWIWLFLSIQCSSIAIDVFLSCKWYLLEHSTLTNVCYTCNSFLEGKL